MSVEGRAGLMAKFPIASMLAALWLVGVCAAAHAQQARTPTQIIVDGSSTVFPVSEAVAEGFMASVANRIRVTVAESGTGGGFSKFCRRATHVTGASRPISAKEMKACAASGVEYVELPIAFDALSVVVHPSNPVKTLTVAQLRMIWQPAAQGRINNWRQVDPSFPDLPLTLYGPGTASGTFDYFTEAVVGRAKSSRNDFTPSEDDNVLVQGVTGDRGALAYFGLAYYLENKSRVRAIAVDNGKGGVYPSVEAVKAGQYAPLARPIFIYVNAAELRRKPVQDFMQYYVSNAAKHAAQVDYVPLPASAYTLLSARLRAREAGTAFGGKSDIGASIEEVLSRKVSKQILD